MNSTAGRWVIEGDLSSYFDTVHHRLLLSAVRKRICDKRFLNLLWTILKSGHVDKGLFRATHEGVPQGGICKALHMPPYAKKVIMPSKTLYPT
jgi:retron-type reverse transcriptase